MKLTCTACTGYTVAQLNHGRVQAWQLGLTFEDRLLYFVPSKPFSLYRHSADWASENPPLLLLEDRWASSCVWAKDKVVYMAFSSV